MRNGGNILNQGYIQTGGLKCADGSFTAGAGAFNENFHRLHTMLHSSLSSNLGSSLCSKGVDFLEPRKPISPADAQETALPCVSVMVTMVLLKVD